MTPHGKVYRIDTQGPVNPLGNSRSDDWWFLDNINHWSKKNRPKGPPRAHKQYNKRGLKKTEI